MIKPARDNVFKYLAENSDDNWGLTITTCGYQHVSPGEGYPPEGHPVSHSFSWENGRKLDAWYIVYIPTGSGIFETESQKYQVNAGDVLLIARNEWHRYKPHAVSGWEEYWVGIKGAYFDRYLHRELFPQGMADVKHIGYNEEILLTFNEMIEVSRKEASIFRKVMLGYFIQIAAYFSREQLKEEHRNRNTFVFESTAEHIRRNLSTEIDFRSLAHTFHISYSSFRRIFKLKAGMPPRQFLIHQRIEAAKRLLGNTDLPVKHIAFRTGFQSISYFSRLYKSKTGRNPLARNE
jgi:AraC-like DNA-binding protein